MHIIMEATMSCMRMIHDWRRPDGRDEDRVHDRRPEQLERVAITGEEKSGESRVGELFAEEEGYQA
jgi:hypothetical protein